MTCVIVDPESLIEHECSDRAARQRDVAKTYGLAILGQRAGATYDWGRMNAAIVARWPKGLLRVKQLAWTFADEGSAAGSGARADAEALGALHCASPAAKDRPTLRLLEGGARGGPPPGRDSRDDDVDEEVRRAIVRRLADPAPLSHSERETVDAQLSVLVDAEPAGGGALSDLRGKLKQHP